MSELIQILDEFWEWTGNSLYWRTKEASRFPFDPLCFPKFDELRNKCIALINTSMSSEEVDAFLVCLALDSEDELILDSCKEFASSLFTSNLLSVGINHMQVGARWQIAELLRKKDIPNKKGYLNRLLKDPHPYVRQRAFNVLCEENGIGDRSKPLKK